MPNKPLREEVIAALIALFEARDPETNADHLVRWEDIARAPMDDGVTRFSAALAILEGRETTTPSAAPVTTRRLELAIEFEVKPFLGEKPAAFVNEVLADIQKTLMGDLQLGGLILNMQETSNETDVESDGDHRVGGVVTIEVTYRHMQADPSAKLGG